MATTQLADIYEPKPFNNAVHQAAIELNAFVASGVMTNNPGLANLATVGGKIGEMPYWNPLTQSEPNYSSDDNTSDSTPEKIDSNSSLYRRAMMNKSWSVMDFTQELAGNVSDPLGAVTSKIGGYWATEIEKRVIQSTMGVLADNVASDSGDMLHSVATDSASAITSAELMSGTVIIRASQTLGDHKDKVVAIAMHSVPHSTLQEAGLLVDNFDPQSGAVMYQTYLGKRVIIDDSLPAIAGTNRITYTSILFGSDAIGYGAGTPHVPSEMDRKAASGDGGGETVIYTRRTDIIHPQGTSFLSATVTGGDTPSLANLALAANWDRKYARKNLPIAFLQTNG